MMKQKSPNLITLSWTKEAITTLENTEEEYAEDYFDDLMNDDLPHH